MPTAADGSIKVRAYPVLRRAVEEGTALGLARAYKHTSTPSREHVAQCVEDAVMSEICDVFHFEESGT